MSSEPTDYPPVLDVLDERDVFDLLRYAICMYQAVAPCSPPDPERTAQLMQRGRAALIADREAAKEHTADTPPSDISTAPDPAPGPHVEVVLPEAQIHPTTEPGGIWRVTWGRLSGLGPDLATAKGHLMVQVLASVHASQEEPAFARTGNDHTAIAIARHNGADYYQTNGSIHWLTARYLDHTPDAVIASDAGAVPLPPRQQLPF
ncbi:hypothetical protein [Streptomyces sp. NPDC056056]|uniref:hypothetical protein n=1 Tax=Streptomyces sp. NPDC056056 TaxID=3345698 RepID=UPI0035DF9C47